MPLGKSALRFVYLFYGLAYGHSLVMLAKPMLLCSPRLGDINSETFK
jgi:hypothetical protein